MPLPPKPRPLRPKRPLPAPGRRKAPLALLAGGAVAAAAVAVALLVTRGRKDEAPPPAVKPKPPVEARYTVHVYHRDLGRERMVALYVTAVPPSRLQKEEFALLDGAGRELRAEAAEAREHFLREFQEDPRGLALAVRPPADAEALDLRLPDGTKAPVYRRPGKDAYQPLFTPVRYEDWNITASGKLLPDNSFDLEIRARPLVETPFPLSPERFILLTDEGTVLTPDVRTRDPVRILYAGVPPTARELRLQTSFRSVTPAYLVEPVSPKGAPPTAKVGTTTVAGPLEKPDPGRPSPPPPQGDTRKEYESRMGDPVAALKFLSDRPGDEARGLAYEALAKTIGDDVAAGLKAFKENKADVAERHLTRAALLSDPYHPELSRQLMRVLFLMKAPRKTLTGCASCKGAGSAACGACQIGLALGKCPRCDEKGEVACILCDGAGTLDHHGFRGMVVLTIESDIKVRIEGKSGTLHAQSVTWQMSLCEGGEFPLQTESVVTKTGSRTTGTVNQPCSKFWSEMKAFVFNGRAKIKVPDRKGQMVPISPTAARRFFADYEVCKGGAVACDRCAGRKNDPCSHCSGKGKAMLLCTDCEGASLKACPACKGYGDASWLSRALPPAAAGTLSRALAEHAGRLRDWMNERSRRGSRRLDLARRLEEAGKGLDPSAKFTDDLVDLTCAICKGSRGECADCWATGRREYFAGTPQHERYALRQRLERQLKEAQALPPDPPVLAALPRAEGAVSVGSGSTLIPSGLGEIPADIGEIIKKADALHETGKAHLEKAKASNDPAIWMPEAIQAHNDLKNAQTLYATAQERLDEKGAPVPKELLLKFRTNMQALVIARRTVP